MIAYTMAVVNSDYCNEQWHTTSVFAAELSEDEAG